MSLEALQAAVEGYRAEAGRLSEDFTRAHAEVDNDPTLSVVGRREKLEPLHQQVTEKINGLRTSEKAAVKAMKENLERRVFGLAPGASSDPAKVVSFRDAQARARQLEHQEDAEELYESAKRSGDTVLSTAILERALIRGWTTIKADFLERNTTTRDDLDDLTALAKHGENWLMNVAHYMPPSLNLPHPSGFPDVPELNTISGPLHASGGRQDARGRGVK